MFIFPQDYFFVAPSLLEGTSSFPEVVPCLPMAEDLQAGGLRRSWFRGGAQRAGSRLWARHLSRAGRLPGLLRAALPQTSGLSSLPEATWPSSDKVHRARAPALAALFLSVWSENLEKQTRVSLKVSGVKYFN